ncbi:hypothetical protein H2O64_03785 [Kordia sp. YSTF-M3]|uniref:Uncharacterized protein n=1 Tax=Kordia aestuariivivens TaxID=2759037 RepID=A0ABR7Q5E0_9FLAO|nr:hypothetical protein [Kordia aestuariivivens]MBC8753776.1 hypothetical protein [Kordia aestuariivivens]
MKKLESLKNGKFKAKELKNTGSIVGATDLSDGASSSYRTSRTYLTSCPPHPAMADHHSDIRFDHSLEPNDRDPSML